MDDDKQNILAKYGSLGTQMLVALGLAAYSGMWIDRKIAITIPIFIWLLPLLVIVVMIVKLIKDTTPKHD
jgi:hypothetical protein